MVSCMKCDISTIEDYIDGYLDCDIKSELESHLQTCKHCHSIYQELLDQEHQLSLHYNHPDNYTSQLFEVMGRIEQRNKRRHTWFNLKLITMNIAVILLSFSLLYLYSNLEGDELSQSSDIKDVAPATVKQPNDGEGENYYNVLIEDVKEEGEFVTISYRVQLNDTHQENQRKKLDEMNQKYKFQSVGYFFEATVKNLKSYAHIAIRDEQNRLIMATKNIPGETPMFEGYTNGRYTENPGEMIYHLSIPKRYNPTTLEVMGVEGTIIDSFETHVHSDNPKPFTYNQSVYTIDDIYDNGESLNITISTKNPIKEMPTNWYIPLGREYLVPSSFTTINVTEDRIVYELEFFSIKDKISYFKLIPFTLKVQQQMETVHDLTSY